MDRARLTESCKNHEGCRLEAYQDTKGIWTVGYGRNLEAMYPGRKNFQGLQIMQATADKWLDEDISKAIADAGAIHEYQYLDTAARQNVLIEMVFNMGSVKVRGFTHTLQAIQFQRWADAAEEMLDSDWHKEVGKRAETLALMMETGEFLS